MIGKYHPHGDTAVYDALVRMAQDFVAALPLVDGQGNFGSRRRRPAGGRSLHRGQADRRWPIELLAELGERTVDMRPNYDGTSEEPVVLPAQFPNLLVNGSAGIAVGMATNIPPHNLGEVVQACVP